MSAEAGQRTVQPSDEVTEKIDPASERIVPIFIGRAALAHDFSMGLLPGRGHAPAAWSRRRARVSRHPASVAGFWRGRT